LKLRL